MGDTVAAAADTPEGKRCTRRAREQHGVLMATQDQGKTIESHFD